MEQTTLRLPESLLAELDDEADEHGVSRSEHVREVLRTRRDTERLQDRLAAREERIEELEEQLSKRSQIEEKIDDLAERDREPDAPFFVDWWRWARDR
jgi:metal-responsive CopG/Arc/MetJ family transcriptional regulator